MAEEQVIFWLFTAIFCVMSTLKTLNRYWDNAKKEEPPDHKGATKNETVRLQVTRNEDEANSEEKEKTGEEIQAKLSDRHKIYTIDSDFNNLLHDEPSSSTHRHDVTILPVNDSIMLPKSILTLQLNENERKSRVIWRF